MKPVSVKYKFLGLFPVTIKGSIPENWEELQPSQIIALACTSNGSISDEAFMAVMLGLRKGVIRRLGDYQRFLLNNELALFSTETMSSRFVIPRITISGTNYYAPKPKLQGMSFSQFIFTDTWFGVYHNTKSPADLNRFMAALCVNNRKNFNEEELEYNSTLFAKVKPEVKEAMVINYHLVKQWLTKAYPFVFPEAEETEEQQHRNTTKQEFDPNTWMRIFDSLVGDDIPNRESYAKWPVNEALRYLNRKIKESLKKKK